ncbi:MAG: ABC transporter substrate-binding protein [Meiothermus sp.]|nr:ABC transporter substrate-binding protein [Meiothermus sp.]
MIRKLLALGIALVLGSGALAQGNILRIPLINDPIMNPVIAPELGSILINKVIFPGLVRPDENLRPTPDLARSWTISQDALTYTFRLRPGVKWHDGQPFTAEDVKFTFDLARDRNSGSRLASDFEPIDRVEVVDPLTVRFVLKRPFAPFLILLGHNAGIIPRHLLQGRNLNDAVDFNRTRPIGTGPFRVTRVQAGASITLEANPDYYGTKPRLAGIVFRIVPDINAQTAQLRAGELDFITIEPSNLSAVERAPNIEVRQAPAVQHFYVGFNQRLPLFRSPEVRLAINYAVNRQAIIDGVLRGYADYPVGTIPPALRDYFAGNLPKITYDPNRARQLLAQAGWRPGPDGILRNAQGEPFKFTLQVDRGNPSREQAALAVQQDLRRIGMDVSLQTMEFAALVRDVILPAKFEAVLTWWTTAPDPDQYSFYGINQSNNQVGYANAEVDRLLQQGRAERNEVIRRTIYARIQNIQLRDPTGLVLYYPREIQAVNARLQGVPNLGIRDALRHTEKFFFGQ